MTSLYIRVKSYKQVFHYIKQTFYYTLLIERPQYLCTNKVYVLPPVINRQWKIIYSPQGIIVMWKMLSSPHAIIFLLLSREKDRDCFVKIKYALYLYLLFPVKPFLSTDKQGRLSGYNTESASVDHSIVFRDYRTRLDVKDLLNIYWIPEKSSKPVTLPNITRHHTLMMIFTITNIPLDQIYNSDHRVLFSLAPIYVNIWKVLLFT